MSSFNRRLMSAALLPGLWLGLAGCAGGEAPAATDEPAAPAPETAAVQATAAVEGDATLANKVTVSLTSFAIDMPTELSAGQAVFEVTNNADVAHNFEIERGEVEMDLGDDLGPGETRALVFTLEPGVYEVYCPVDGHRDQGMSVELTVTE